MRFAVIVGLFGVALLVVAFAGFALWVRLAPTDVARWHIEPATAQAPASPNFARLEQATRLSPAEAAAALAAQAASEGATQIAGDEVFGTWIARTRVMGYPDFVSIRLTPTDDGTQIIALSRSRFGHSDMGVNAARLQRWIGRLAE